MNKGTILLYPAIAICAYFYLNWDKENRAENRTGFLNHLSPAEQIQQLDAWDEAEENNDDGFQGYDMD